MNRIVASLAAAAAACLAMVAPAAAQTVAEIQKRLKESRPADFPTRPLEFVVTYPAGGGMDVSARILAKYVEKYAEHQIVVMNRAGAGGLIGHTYVATQAKPDGYTIGIISSNYWADAILRSDGKFTPQSMDPLAFINFDPVTWIVHTNGRFGKAGLKEIIAAAREKPGGVRLAASDSTATGFLALMVEMAAGVSFNKVQYQGGRQALTDLLGQHIDASFGFLGEYKAQLQAGTVKVVAVAGSRRVPVLKDVPTFNEVLGTDDIVWDAFRFAAVPRGVPPARKAWLEAALNAALGDPALAAEYAELGATVDRSLGTARQVAEEVDRRSSKERAFYIKVGRLKP